MQKEATVIVAASGERYEITIKPGTSAEDILRDIEHEGYVLSKTGDSTSFFDPRDDVYPEVENGVKLWASTKPDVGSEVGFGPPAPYGAHRAARCGGSR